MNIVLPEKVQFIINTLKDKGFEAFIVGGCTRDSLLGLKPKDWDITTSAMAEDVINSFDKTIPTGIKHGTVTVMIKNESFEVTTYRIDGAYTDNRRPDQVFFTSNIEEDLSRRDFTINSMAYNNEKGLIDPFNGQNDLNKKLIKCVGDPNLRFNEDALRMIRAIRFSSQIGFAIDEATFNAIQSNAKLICNVSSERIRIELDKILLSSDVILGIKNLNKSNLLKYILNIKDIKKNENRCYNIIKYTKSNIYIRLAVFLYTLLEDISEIRGVLKKLKYDNNTLNIVVAIIENFKNLLGDIEDKDLKTYINGVGLKNLDYIISFMDAYLQGSSETKLFNEFESTKVKIQIILGNKEPLFIKDLKISGDDLIKIGFQKGKLIGETLNYLLSVIFENQELNNYEQLKKIALKRLEKAGD
jgi:tRNA nucleotidyltransferase (CCA-adding enzyme)